MTEAQAYELAWTVVEKHVKRIAASTPSESGRVGSATPLAEAVKEALMSAYNDGWENGFEEGQQNR